MSVQTYCQDRVAPFFAAGQPAVAAGVLNHGCRPRTVLGSSDEALNIDLLRLLRGVAWPTASVILHFCDARPYPILDVRVLWSLGYDTPTRYTMEFWLAYVEYTRGLAERLGVDMRAVDKGLWQYSKERRW